MLTIEQIDTIKTLGYVIEPNDEHAFINLIATYFGNLELKKLLVQFEEMLSPWSKHPELKELRFFCRPRTMVPHSILF
jgi:hypothetical protein